MDHKTEKRHAGRPVKNDDDRKDKQLHIRVTNAELADINAQVAQSGLKQADWLRKKLGLNL